MKIEAIQKSNQKAATQYNPRYNEYFEIAVGRDFYGLLSYSRKHGTLNETTKKAMFF